MTVSVIDAEVEVFAQWPWSPEMFASGSLASVEWVSGASFGFRKMNFRSDSFDL